MNEQSSEIAQAVMWGVGVAVPITVAVIGGLCGLIILLLKRGADQRDRAEQGREGELRLTRERVTDKQATQGELMAGVVARIGQLEHGYGKLEDGQGQIAEALNRLTKLEEFRQHAMPRLEEAEETARTLIAFGEQMKSVFKRIDAMTEQMNKQTEKINDMPDAVVTKLRDFVRLAPKQAGRAANG